MDFEVRQDAHAPLLGFQLESLSAATVRDWSLPSDRAAQEQLLYDDALRVIVGAQGTFIHKRQKRKSLLALYSVHPSADLSLGDATVPLCELAARHEFIRAHAAMLSALNMGQIQNALGVALRSLSQRLVGQCAELEKRPKKSLHELNLALMPMARTYEYLYAVVEELQANELHGGAILCMLSQKLEIYRGSALAKQTLIELVDCASRPFIEMLTAWIVEGQIHDPYNEFMVHVRSESTLLSDDWDKYHVETSLVPLELSSPDLYNKCLLAGKYLNVVAECGAAAAATASTSLDTIASLLDNKLEIIISKAYEFANEQLLRLLRDQSLLQRLITFKHTFFLDESDFLPTFLELAAKELRLPAERASLHKLQYSLDIAVHQPGTLSSANDQLDELRLSFASSGLFDQLLHIASISGISHEQFELLGEDAVTFTELTSLSSSFSALQALQLDFEIPFPQNLVITESSVLRYQFLFRLLLLLRTCIDSINSAWAHQTKSPIWRNKSHDKDFENLKHKATSLRSKFVHLLQIMLYYFTTNVIESNWNAFYPSVATSQWVDAIQSNHSEFLDKCLKECLLTRSEILMCQFKLFQLAAMYATFLKSHESTLYWIDPSIDTQFKPEPTTRSGPELLEFMREMVAKYEQGYSKYVRKLVAELDAAHFRENTTVCSLLTRIEQFVQ